LGFTILNTRNKKTHIHTYWNSKEPSILFSTRLRYVDFLSYSTHNKLYKTHVHKGRNQYPVPPFTFLWTLWRWRHLNKCFQNVLSTYSIVFAGPLTVTWSKKCISLESCWQDLSNNMSHDVVMVRTFMTFERWPWRERPISSKKRTWIYNKPLLSDNENRFRNYWTVLE
jgi:hypothetical protein